MPQPVPMSTAVRARRCELQAREGLGGPADAEHVVLGERTLEGRLVEVTGDPPLDLSLVVGEGLRPHQHGGSHGIPRDLQQSERGSSVDAQRRQRRLGVTARDGQPEPPQTTQHGERIAALTQRARGRAAETPRDGVVGLGSPGGAEGGARVVRGAEVVGEGLAQLGIGFGKHRSIQPSARGYRGACR